MKVQCLIPDTVIVMGQPSHTEYIFNDENNHVLEIKEEDWPDLEQKTKTDGCCGNPRRTYNIFQKIE